MEKFARNSGGKRKKWETEQILREIEKQNKHTEDDEEIPSKVFLRELTNALAVRAVQFFFLCLALSLFLHAQDDNENAGVASLQNIYPLELITFVTAVFAINAGATCFDYALFYFLEVHWTGNYDLVYYANSVHGALGRVLTLVIVINVLYPMKVMQKLGTSLRPFTSACLVIGIFYSFKEYYLRKHFKRLLKVRLKKKLAKMEEWSHILSELCNYQPLTKSSMHEEDPCVMDNEGGEIALNPINRVDESGVSGLETSSSQLHHCFSSDQKVTIPANRSRFSCNIFSRNSNSSYYGTDGKPQASDGGNTFQFDEEKRENGDYFNFWRQLRVLKRGHLRVCGRYGVATIRGRKQAEEFGNQLYMHLTNGNTIPFTAVRISEILTQNPLTPAQHIALGIENEGSVDVILTALLLFRCDESPMDQNGISPSVAQVDIVNGVINVFKEIQFSKASLRDLSSLHEAAKSVVDMIFFAFMLLVAQIILKVELSQILAPLLTILFGLSFAFAVALSNLFLSMAFVMFLLPFNVGNRVAVGKTDKIIGNIFEMRLMYTTILTRHNEMLRIPNHVLFNEHITNLSEGSVSTFVIPIAFALDGPYFCSQEKIHTFIKRVKKFVKEDPNSDWLDIIAFCEEISSGTNQLKYSFWCTHRAAYDEVNRRCNGLTKLLEEMRRLQVELDIHFQNGIKLLQ